MQWLVHASLRYANICVHTKLALQVTVSTEPFQMAFADCHIWSSQPGACLRLSCCADCSQEVHKGGRSAVPSSASPGISASVGEISSRERQPLHILLQLICCIKSSTLLCYFGFHATQHLTKQTVIKSSCGMQGNRGFAYAVLYAAMNIASLLSGWTLDLFRITLRDGFGISGRPADSILNSGYRLYLVLGESLTARCIW